MKTTKIIQKNEKLAIFHNQAVYSDEYTAWWIIGRIYGSRTLDYHKNYNNLMSVVQQIESLGFIVNINKKQCKIAKDNNSEQYFVVKEYPTKLESIYEACVAFICDHYISCKKCNSRNIYQFTQHLISKSKTNFNYCKSCGNSWQVN